MNNFQNLRTRFAPTPSGYLHIGNAWSFFLTWLIVRHYGGSIHLRIDDLDQSRYRKEYLDDIFSSLEWLGFNWDTGPNDSNDFLKNYSQIHNQKDYRNALEILLNQPKDATSNIYACECSRKQIALIYSGLCRHKNGQPSYQLGSVVDDERLGINFIIRGRDLFSSTGGQLFLARCLGAKKILAAQFFHHGLVLGPQGEKISKKNQIELIKPFEDKPKQNSLSPRLVESPLVLKNWTLKSLRSKPEGREKLFKAFANLLGLDTSDADGFKYLGAQEIFQDFRPENISILDLSYNDFEMLNYF